MCNSAALGSCSSSGKYSYSHCILTPSATSLHISRSKYLLIFVVGNCLSIWICSHSVLYPLKVFSFPSGKSLYNTDSI